MITINGNLNDSVIITSEMKARQKREKELLKQKEWDETFIENLKSYEKHSKCSAKKVACILVKDNNILSIGINGTMSGKTNCNELFKKEDGKWYKKENSIWVECNKDEHHRWSNFNEIHAEMNAIKKASQVNGFNLENSTAYISFSPCFSCAKALVLFGVKRIVFLEEYDDAEEVIKFLKEQNVDVVNLSENKNSGVTFVGYSCMTCAEYKFKITEIFITDENCKLKRIYVNNGEESSFLNRDMEEILELFKNINGTNVAFQYMDKAIVDTFDFKRISILYTYKNDVPIITYDRKDR